MALKIITCPWCGREARITYEENRVYQMKCYSCHNTMLHVDHSFDSAVEFFEHHADLLQAEKDGRLVVLPCRRGDRLFVLTSDSPDGIEETKCKRITIVNRWDRSTAKVIVKCVYDDWGKAVREFWPEDFGKAVFMTREEAEAALKGGEG